MYDVPSRRDIAQVLITGETVRERANPTLIPRASPLRGGPNPRLPREKSA